METSKTLNIAYLSDSFIPSTRANTVHVIKMCAAFAESGVETTLYCNYEKDFKVEDIFKKYNVRVKYNLIAEKAKITGKLKMLEYARKKAKDVERQKPDVCYGRSLLALFLLRNRLPFIYESHIRPNRKLFLFLEKAILRNKNRVKLVVISENLKQEYLKLFSFLHDEDIVVLHDGADEVLSKPDHEKVPIELRKAHEKGVTIGYIGHLYPGKCMETLIPVAKTLPNRYFHIVGGTEEWISHWKDECKKERIDNIVFYGYIDNAAVNACYDNIDVVVLPFSNGIYFNKDKKDDIGKWISPLKLFEAMANGKAIISSDLPSIEEVIDNDYDGLLIPAADIEGWKEAIEFLCTNVEKRSILGINAKAKLKSQYTWKHRAETIIELFKGRGNQ